MVNPVPFWRRPRAQLLALTALLWAIVLGVVVGARDVLLPFMLAALAAYVIDPLALLHVGGRRVPRAAAVVAVYVVLGFGVYLFSVSVVPQIYREVIRG